MITYNYTFTRDEGDSVITYKPKYPTDFFNVVNLKGDSSTGKSTLMNLIAMAFYGNDDPKLSLELRNRVDYLYNNENVVLDFEIELTSSTGKKLKSHVVKARTDDGTLTRPEITVVEVDNNGVEHNIFKDKFRQNYCLIYDIPDNPTKRLEDSVKEISAAQDFYYERIMGLRKLASNLSESIHKSGDQAHLEELKVSITQYKADLEDCRGKIKVNEDLSNNLEKLYQAKRLSLIMGNIKHFSKMHDDIKKGNKEIKKTNKLALVAYNNAMVDYQNAEREFRDAYDGAYNSLEILEQCAGIDTIVSSSWKDFKPNINFSIGLKDIPADFIPATTSLIRLIKGKCEELYSEEDVSKKELLEQFLGILKDYSAIHKKTEILDRPADALYNELMAEYTSIEEKVSTYTSYAHSLKLISDCLVKGYEAHNSFLKVPEKPESLSGVASVEEIKEKLKKLEEQKSEELSAAVEYGVTETNYDQVITDAQLSPLLKGYCELTDSCLKSCLDELKLKITSLNGDIEGYISKIAIKENELKELEGHEVHKLAPYINKIDLLVKSITEIQKDLDKKRSILLKFIKRNENLVNLKLDSNQEKYLKIVWKDLGKRFGRIQFVGSWYDIAEVNLLTSKIITTTNKIIPIDDMGTGESQSAYLRNVLRSNENFCIIAMFDESENMDFKLRHGILEEFKRLYDEDHLLLGMISSHGKPGEFIAEGFNDAQ